MVVKETKRAPARQKKVIRAAAMGSRSLWKASIHVGAIDVPVKLQTAVREERIAFHLLHKKDHVRLKQQMVCAYEKAPVPAEEQVKGFEVEEGKYVLIDPEDLDKVEAEDSRTIDVHEFVKAEEIDPLLRERVYYLQPDAQVKGYAALAAALEEMHMEGICTWTMRKRSYVGALHARGGILRLSTLRYADEVIPAASLELPDVPLSEQELKIGTDLVGQLTKPFQPQQFENEHQNRLQELIDKKARGEKIRTVRPRRAAATASDKLLATLKASLRKTA
jgi:DNA end-binding protein Ku